MPDDNWERVRRLEEQPCATKMLNHAEGEVDKSVLVIGGCADDLLEQAAEMVRDMLAKCGWIRRRKSLVPIEKL